MVPFHWTKCKIRPILNVYSFFRDAKQKILYSLKTFYYKHKKKIWTRKVRRFLQVRSLEQSKIYINLKTLNVMLGRWTIFSLLSVSMSQSQVLKAWAFRLQNSSVTQMQKKSSPSPTFFFFFLSSFITCFLLWDYFFLSS